MKRLAAALTLSAATAFILFLPAVAGGQARPGPSVVAGARRPPDVSFARRVKRGCDRYVSTAGDDANSGRSVRRAWRTIGMALRTLRAGQVGCVLPGTYEEGHNEAGHDGTAAAPIVLRRAPGSSAMPVVKPKGPVAVFHIDRDYWVLDGFDVDVSFQKVTGVRFMENADHGVLRNSRVHNSTSGASVYVAGRDILVESCDIFNNFQTNEQDSHGVAIVQSAARVMVRRSRIWDNGGDGIQCEDYADAPANPEDITLEDNLIYTTPANMGRTENAVDIKSCRFVTVRGRARPGAAGRTSAGNVFYGFALKPTARGEAVVVHYNARHVLIENTVIRDACRGVSVGRGEDRTTLVENMVVRGNLIEDLRQGQNCDGDAILISRAHHLDVYDNILRNIPRAGFRAGVNNSTGVPDRDIDFWGNRVGPAARWLNLGAEAGQLEGFASDRNLFVGDAEDAAKFYLNGKFISFREWRRMSNTAPVLVADPRGRVRRAAAQR
ncbi:MAG TPA: right-handed parallel beta-helix repeat-containing protein [Pyrinomonadaceae bacterium]